MVITRGTNVRSAMLNNNNRLSIFLGKRFETWRGEGRGGIIRRELFEDRRADKNR